MRSLGIGAGFMLKGQLIFGLLLGGVMLLLSSALSPWGLVAVKDVVSDIIKRNMAADIRAGVFYDEVSNLTFYTESIDEKKSEWGNVWVHDDRDPNAPILLIAENGSIQTGNLDESLQLKLRNGIVHRLDKQTGEYTTLNYETGDMLFGLGDALPKKNRFRASYDLLTWSQLRDAEKEAIVSKEDPLPYVMAIHSRLRHALMPFALAIIGFPLAMNRRAGAKARGTLLAMLAYVFYYVIGRLAEGMGLRGEWNPWIASQMVNIVYLIVGLLLLHRVSKTGALR